ncbi:hypothetical protein [Thalassobacillus hwangdonensis]|uniref:General stress protein n=1 Tax=Thalassobacillus hwangdonensis TaxID=546108 RepID=A0ABW3L209_9BACI
MRESMIKKYIRLWTGELIASILFAFLWFYAIKSMESIAAYVTSYPAVYAFLVLEFILLQGSFYWYMKWKQAKQGNFSRMTKSQCRWFTYLKRITFALLAYGILLVIYQIMVAAPTIYLFLFLYIFAIGEYVNYYHIRLSYQSVDDLRLLFSQRGARASKLAKELKNSL